MTYKAPISWRNAPEIDDQLIEYLDMVYPNKLPDDINITDRELGAKVGEQRVLNHLRSLHSQQKDEYLENVLA